MFNSNLFQIYDVGASPSSIEAIYVENKTTVKRYHNCSGLQQFDKYVNLYLRFSRMKGVPVLLRVFIEDEKRKNWVNKLTYSDEHSELTIVSIFIEKTEG